jgi:hypothetical protein
MKKLSSILTLAVTVIAASVFHSSYAPGARIQLLAHNAYPDHGKYADRLDHAIAAGVPFVVEEDLAWIDGKSLLIHGAKNAGSSDPTLETYFFPKVKPIMEKALQDGDQTQWPLITLYLDIKNDPIEHLQAISEVLDKYNSWLTTAVKTSNLATQSPLDVKPMMVLVEDKQRDIKQQFFYDSLPVGGKIRVFGSVTKPALPTGPNLTKQEAIERMAGVDPATIVSAKADNYHRWWGSDWAFIEKGGEEHAGGWTPEENARLQKWVRYGHNLGYFVGFYCLDGFTSDQNHGWEAEYNLGSQSAAETRWKALIQAHADFISTDQYEDLGKLLHSFHHAATE